MTSGNFTTAISVDQTPEEAYAAINDVRGWWSGEIDGPTDKLGEEFTYRYKDIHYSKQKVIELAPNTKIVWRVVDSALNFVPNTKEWNGTTIVFDIARKGDKTEVRFTHEGLVPEFECFDDCSSAWSFYINSSLRDFIASGQRRPNPKEN